MSTQPKIERRPGERILEWPDLRVVVLDSGEVGQFWQSGRLTRREVEERVRNA